jgi:hypothetical protein
MIITHFKIMFLVFAGILSMVAKGHAQEDQDERHIKVAMRLIGHELLLSSGDSVSIVLPVERQSDRYKIQFASEFEVDPDKLAFIVDSVIKEARIAARYVVEVERCHLEGVAYSYEFGNSDLTSLVPCKGRVLPKACYVLFITFWDLSKPIAAANTSPADGLNGTASEASRGDYFSIILVALGLLLVIALPVYTRRKKRVVNLNTHLIPIGAYQFDKRNMALSFNNETVDLTSKEADLLFLLHTSANSTLEREVILKNVWGDEGDYVGRTLDVFISKLRKKLEADSTVKIVNIRGVGYKLIVNS